MKPITKWNRIIMKLRLLFVPDGPLGDRARGKLYEPYLKSFGKNFKVGSQAYIFNPNGLEVGDDVYIGFNTYLGQGSVKLENEVLIGNFVSITASNHLMKGDSFRFGGFKAETITIGYGTWVGAQSAITAGVNIGKSCLVAAGSVVTKSVEDRIVVGGIPAKKLMSIDEFIKKNKIKDE